jgi:4-hydroxybenzoate polyprenyltransferase
MYVFGPALIGTIISLVSLGSIQVSGSHLIALLYFTFPANLLIYGINDIFDGDTDQYNPKKNTYENQHSQSQTKLLATIIALTNLPFLLYLFGQNPHTLIYSIAFIFFSIQYSALPIRAKAKPFIDGIFNFLYVAPALVTVSLLTPNLITTKTIPLILAATFWCMAMHAYSAIPDIEADQKAGLTTTAVLLGDTKTFTYCFVLYLATASLVFLEGGVWLGAPLFIYPLVIGYNSVNQDKTFQIYKYFPYLNTAIGFLISIQLIYKLF